MVGFLYISKNFSIPILFEKKKILEYQLETKEYTNEEMETLLKNNFDYYCSELESKGITILEKNLDISYEPNGARGTGTIILQESVGIKRKIIAF